MTTRRNIVIFPRRGRGKGSHTHTVSQSLLSNNPKSVFHQFPKNDRTNTHFHCVKSYFHWWTSHVTSPLSIPKETSLKFYYYLNTFESLLLPSIPIKSQLTTPTCSSFHLSYSFPSNNPFSHKHAPNFLHTVSYITIAKDIKLFSTDPSQMASSASPPGFKISITVAFIFSLIVLLPKSGKKKWFPHNLYI